MIAGLARTYDAVPLLAAPDLGSLTAAAQLAFSGIFAAAVQVCAPVLLALILTDAALGVVSQGRAAAQRLRGRLPGQGRRRPAARRRLAAVRRRLAGGPSCSARSRTALQIGLRVAVLRWPQRPATRTEKATPKKQATTRAQEGPGRALDGPQRRGRPARRAVRALRVRARHVPPDGGRDARAPAATSPSPTSSGARASADVLSTVASAWLLAVAADRRRVPRRRPDRRRSPRSASSRSPAGAQARPRRSSTRSRARR